MSAQAEESAYDLVTPTGTLFGTASVPPVALPVPVALIIAGSGPTDRNGNAPQLQLNMYAKLARALAQTGIATVRYDKRGIGQSSAAISSESDLRFETYAVDAAAWIAKLRSDSRFSSVSVVGHSEGALLGMLAAQQAAVDAFVSLAGTGFPLATVLRRQLAPQLAPYPQVAAQAETIITALSNGKPVAEADIPPLLAALFRPSVQPYVISCLRYDPRVEIAKLTCRISIIAGTHDVQVTLDDAKALAAAAPKAALVTLEGMTHVLTDDTATTLAGQVGGAYADPDRALDARLVPAIVAAMTGHP